MRADEGEGRKRDGTEFEERSGSRAWARARVQFEAISVERHS